MISLKISLVIIALLDIVIGGASIGIAVIAFTKYNAELALVAFLCMSSVCFVLALVSLYAIANKTTKLLKFYFFWKCMEVLALPVFEIIIVFTTIGGQQLNSSPSKAYYGFVVGKAFLRAYFSYLIYSFYMRIERGETLLVDFGGRKLS